MFSLSTFYTETTHTQEQPLWPCLQTDLPTLKLIINSLFDEKVSLFLETIKQLANQNAEMAWTFKQILRLGDQLLEILKTEASSVKLLKMALIAFEINQMSPFDFFDLLYYQHDSFCFLRKYDALQSTLGIDQLKTFISQWTNKDIRLTMLHYYQLCEIGCTFKEQKKLQLAYIITSRIYYNDSDVNRLYDLYYFDLDLRLRSETIIQRIKELNTKSNK